MTKDKRHEALETLSVLALALLLFAIFLGKPVLVYFAIGALVIGLFISPLAKLISRGWLALGGVMGKIVTGLLLSLFYYLFLSPIAFVYRIFSKKDLMRVDEKKNSYFIERNHVFSEKDIKNPW